MSSKNKFLNGPGGQDSNLKLKLLSSPIYDPAELKQHYDKVV